MNRIERLVNAKPRRPDHDKVVSRHQYQRDSQSGAGNCWCGRHEGHRMHRWSDPRDYGPPSEGNPCEFCGSWGDVHDIWCGDADTETSQQATP